MSINFTGMIQKFLVCCAAGSCLLVSIVMAQGTATYDLTFTATWTSSTHPTDFPSNPHFSGMIGGTHNSAVSFWDTGAIASDGIKQMAETWRQGTSLRNEINQAISALNAGGIVEGSVMNSPGSQTITFDIQPILEPCDSYINGGTQPGLVCRCVRVWIYWVRMGIGLIRSRLIYLCTMQEPIAAPTYTSPNQETIPREPISRITELSVSG